MKKSANAKRNPLPLCVFLCLLLSCSGSQTTDYSLLVNPFIGTDFTGNTYPGAQVPFGMVQLSPDIGRSGWNRISGYYYPDSTIAGFRLQPHPPFRHRCRRPLRHFLSARDLSLAGGAGRIGHPFPF